MKSSRLANRFSIFCLSATLFVFMGCNKSLSLDRPAHNPGAVYDDMWQAMNRNYALFTIKGVNWDSVYSANRPEITSNLSDDQLFSQLSSTLETLKDGHITLISSKDTATYEGFYKSFPVNFNLRNIKETYLKNQYLTAGPVIYKIQDSIGYVYYSSFRNDISEADLRVIFGDLVKTKGLIIDIRSNTGGNLSNVEKLFSRFIPETMLVKYEIFKNGPGRTELAAGKPFYISPSSQTYNHPVVLLTNRTCFSACNDFVLFMSYLPNVTILGDQTGGGGAIPSDYLLANGWKLQYSASMTVSRDHLPVENGITPDIYMNINAIDDANGRDPILEKGFDMLK